MGFFKKVFRPVRKIAKKIIPKEIRPFLPYAAAMIPGAQGLAAAGGITNIAAQKALIAGLTAAATDEDANILRTAALAGGPDALSQGLGKLSQVGNIPYGPQSQGSLSGLLKGGQQMAKAGSEILNPTTFTGKAKLIGGQTAVDQSAKFAEIRQDEIDEYNRNLLEQGVASKVDRRNAIFGIYKNAGYEEDYINTMLDTYGYAGGGITTLKRGLVDQAGSYSGRRNIPGETEAMTRFQEKLDGIIPKRKPKKRNIKTDSEGNQYIEEEDDGNKNLIAGLSAAMDGVQKAYGRSFGEMEPVPMARFARGGEVEIEEQTDDLGIMDLMRDQGVEYGEQVSNAQNDELLEKLFEEFLDLGFSPEDAAKKAREAFDDMSQGQGIKGTQVASGYKDDIEEMYEQYVFEMEEQGLQPMDFASFLRQARSGMASGGRVNYAGGGASYNSSGRYSYLINKYNKGIPLTPSEEDELEMLEMTYADDSQGYAGGGKVSALMELGKAGIKSSMQGLSKLKNMVVTKLSRMTDDVELRGSTDYAEDTGASFELQVTAKTKKGKKTLDSLVEEGVVEKLDDNTYFISDANRDAISGMKGLKASGMLDEGAETFTRFDQGAGRGVMDMPYAGYDEVIDTFSKKAEGGIMNRNLLNTGMDKDMRGGGFIPEGTKEKADDVPARLSKNEFVMTADAVRAAGGGSVNEGAKRMYETMHKLEAKV